MSDFLQRIKDLPAGKLALLAAQLQERLEQAEARARADGPIAVVGAGCRFPGGADDPDAYWDLLLEGRDAVREVPADRWDAEALYDADLGADGKMTSKWGGFLDDIDQFDARLFGISPREATTMDPQQRLLLEATWQALERAGIAPGSLLGSRTGVFVGISATDYLQLQMRRGLDVIDGYLASGAAPSVAAGRIAYVLGLNGPTISVDTACSSSLVAVHLAVQALRGGQCDAAIAGGVNVILSPVTTIALSKAQMLAADGRCKAFSARADGFVRGEGCGVIVLKRLEDAREAGDPIVGVIRGAAVNQDGRSNGLTAPNGPSQEAVIAAALADAGVDPAEIGYVEAHGTGTRLGDPIEVQALAAALGQDRAPDRRLTIGSVKTNLGHLESAAGIAGLIKSMLVLERGIIPAHQHMDEPSSVIPWAQLPIDVATTTTPWPLAGPRLAGVSSFGFSGTNAHVVLEAPPVAPSPPADERPTEVLTLSAQSPAAVEELARRLAAHLDHHEGVALGDLCLTLNTGRDAFAHREAFVAGSVADLRADLAARGRGEPPRRSTSGHVESTRPVRPVFLFTGQGAQHGGMGRELYDHEPVVAEILDRCDAFLRERFGLPLLEVMFSEDDARIHQTAFTQPAIFSLEVALAALWRSWGVEPAAVLGHSVGEYAAAHVAGLFELDDALQLIATRGQLMQSVTAPGRMVAVMAPAEVVAPLVADHAERVSIAAVNGPESVVVSGDPDEVQAVLDTLDTLDARFERRELEVSHAFHSPAMDGILPAFRAAASAATYREVQLPIISNVVGREADIDLLGTADYWTQHIREPVLFGPALATLVGQGHRVFLELGPHPALVAMASRSVRGDGLHWIPTLRRERSDLRELAAAAGVLWCNGVPVDWRRWHEGHGGRRLVLPTYPLQRQRYWIDGVVPWGAEDHAARAPVDLTGLVYDVAWRPVASPADRTAPPATFLRPIEETGARVDERAGDVAAANGVAGYDRFLPELDDLCAAYVIDGLRQLGLPLLVGDRLSFEDVEALGVLDAHHRLVRRLLEILTEDGWLRADGGTWIVERREDDAAARRRAAMQGRFAAFAGELDLVDRCGALLPGILRGEVDPLHVLFPGGSTAQMERIYRDAPMARTFNELVGEAVGTVVAATPPGRTLRVLEVGAGSGATTDSVLPVLAPHAVDYLFTDISAAFTVKARDRYRTTPSVRFGTFDASVDPAGQGLAAGTFDLVIAANVVHATPDVRATLTHLRTLLAPGGQLVLLEATTRERFADLTVGFTPGWWAFEDLVRRPDYALLDRDGWRTVLADAGFASALVAPDRGAEPALRREAVIVASAPAPAGPPEESATPDGRWVLVGAGPLSAALDGALVASGDRVSTVPGGDRTALRDALTEREGTTPTGVVVVCDPSRPTSGDDAAHRIHQQEQTEAVLATVHELLAGPHPPPLWLVTQGAQPVAGEPVTTPDAAPVWGVGQVIELEHPELRCRRIDLDLGPPSSVVDPLVHELREPDPDEPQLAWRGSARYARRLAAADLVPAPPVRLDSDGCYVVSGGLRGLGLLVAGWLVEHGARQLVLFGRRAADDHALAAVERWRQAGVIVAVETADAGVDADVRRVVERAKALAPIRGVVHAAGTLDDAALLRQDWTRFETVFGPKVFGTASLLRHVDVEQLDFLVLFASGVGVGGSPGQANHAAANAYLDALAHQLRARGVKAVSIDWGAWARIGAAADRGIGDAPGAFTPEQGLAVLGYAIGRTIALDGPPQLLVHSPDWSDLSSRFPAGREPALYRDLLAARAAGAPGQPVTTDGDGPATLLDELLGLSERRRRLVLRQHVRRLAAKVLDLDDPELVEVGQPLHDLGLDSLMAVELRNLLGRAIGDELPATLLFEHPSVNELVDHLLAEHLGAVPVPYEPSSEPSPAPEAPAAAAQLLDGPADDVAAALAARLDRLSRGATAS